MTFTPYDELEAYVRYQKQKYGTDSKSNVRECIYWIKRKLEDMRLLGQIHDYRPAVTFDTVTEKFEVVVHNERGTEKYFHV